MDEDDDCYGFGALTEMFEERHDAKRSDGVENQTVERLDMTAMSRYWWSEHKLVRFRHQQKTTQQEYHHIALKFNGHRVDGGLGSAFLLLDHAYEQGLLWIQLSSSDTNAHLQRKQEFQDITNCQETERTEHGPKSTSAVFLPLNEVITLETTTIQHKIHGIRVHTCHENTLELEFMPGPFYNAKHRDTVLQTMIQAQQAAKAALSVEPSPQQAQPLSVEPSPPSTMVKMIEDKHRTMIRSYLKLGDNTSSEAISLAQEIFSATGYPIGPCKPPPFPHFDVDVEYRKQALEELSHKLVRMKETWRLDEENRKATTEAAYKKVGDDRLQYTDTKTGQVISAQEYQQRYMKTIATNNTDPVLHLFPITETLATITNKETDVSADIKLWSTVVDKDLSKCVFLNADFFINLRAETSRLTGASRMETEQEKQAYRTLESNLCSAFNTYYKDFMEEKTKLQPIPSRKRSSQSRRQSLAQPDLSSLNQALESTTEQESSRIERRPVTVRSKRKRTTDALNKSPAESMPTRRRRSIIAEETLLSPKIRHSPRLRQSSPGVKPETPGKDKTCPLCCDAEVIITMKPCSHGVCKSCWNRLITIEGSADQRQCPWDREHVSPVYMSK